MFPQLLAFITSLCYASALVSARRGLKYSTPTTVTLVSILMQNLLLWSALFLTSGLHAVPWEGVLLFTLVGIFQLAVRLLAYTGVEKIGASRSGALQSINPLVSATLAVIFLRETATVLIVIGTLLVVGGIVLVSWKPEQQVPGFRRWHLLLPVGAACLTGINHPIRRYVLTMANEPLFFSALMGTVSLGGFLIYLAVSPRSQRLVWNSQGLLPFLATGLFETLSILFIITSLSIGQVVVITPIAASYPVWSLIGAKVFLRELEPTDWRIVAGILSVVAGNAAILLGEVRALVSRRRLAYDRNRRSISYMEIYDISLSLSAATVRWVTAQPFELIERKRMSRGDANNSSSMHTSVHAGTHVDAPFHFVPDGATIESLPLDLFMGPARVCALETVSQIGAAEIARLDLAGEKRVLFKTRNSSLLHKADYDPSFVAFAEDGAKALVELGVKLVGLDYLSVARADEQVPVHRAFLDHRLVLLEGVDLSAVPPGRYELICLPIKIAGADGAPCRAVLRELPDGKETK